MPLDIESAAFETPSAHADVRPSQVVECVCAEARRLRETRGTKRIVPFEERLSLLAGLSARLLARDPGLSTVFAQPGAAFLAEFLQPSALRRLVAREVPDAEMLSRFVSRGGDRTAIRLVPRGLVCHWLAGNVPLLGALSWAVSVLVGNGNLLRLSSQQDDVITPLLRALAETGDSGETLAMETSVVRFDRDDMAAHRTMSEAADVRIAWGGRESVEVVKSLPSRWDCEDVILGPRVSFAVVDPATTTTAALRRLATDVVYFDQQACSSPQIVFVRGRTFEEQFARFVGELSEEIRKKAAAVPRRRLDYGETYRIALDRSRVLLAGGNLVRDDGTSWTVAVLPEPSPDVRCANRFVQIVPFLSFDDVLRHIPPNVQTIVTQLPAKDLETFTDAACVRGVCRFPAPGEGNRFETPWDGIPLVSRLTRWVSRTEPPGSGRTTSS